MSALSVDSGGTAAVEKLVEQCQGLHRALARSRATRRFLLLGFLAFFLVFVVLYWQLLDRLRSKEYQNSLFTAGQKRLEERSDEYMKQVEMLVSKTSPTVAKSFSEQVQKDIPTYLKAAEREGNQFADDIKAKAETRYREQVRRILAKHQDILMEEIPTLKDIELRERMVRNMARALEQLGKKYAINPIGTELATLYDRWDNFPAVPPPSPGDAPLEERTVGMSLELVRNRIVELPLSR